MGNGAEAKLDCNGKAIGDEIRTEQVALLASKIAQRPVVRSIHVTKANAKSVRNTPSLRMAAIPALWCSRMRHSRFFLLRLRLPAPYAAKHDLAKLGIYADLATLEKIWLNATKQDRDRKIAPLRPADDAKIIDNSN